MEAIAIVQKAVELWKKIVDAPEQVDKIGKRMVRLESYLLGLKELISDKRRHSLASLRPAQAKELQSIIKDIETDSERVYDILQKWENSIGPFGLQLRYKTIANAMFALGSSTDKLDSLSEDIQQHKDDLRDSLQLMGYFKLNNLQPPVPAQLTKPGNNRNPSPSPSPSRKDFKVIFVDPYNIGRSRVAESYMQLVRGWTTRTQGNWRVTTCHSAGMMVKARSDCVAVLEGLQPPLKQNFMNGGEKPNWTGLATLFDSPIFNYPYKNEIRDSALSRKSRGISQRIFSEFDFVLVFTGREDENLKRLKKALVEKNGQGAAPKGKGRVLHLGAYLGGNGKTVEIVDAPKNKDGTDSKENWNKTTAQIKLAIKMFLKRELDWVQPAKGAVLN
jgi:protein-tyrosine-phosphatase